MARKSAHQVLLETILGDEKVRYFPALSKALNCTKAGLMLSQLLYWDGKNFKGKIDGWFWVGIEAMYQQTGLKAEHQRTARTKIEKAGVCEMKLKGLPKRWWYRPDLELIGELIRPPSLVEKVDQRTLRNPIDIEPVSQPISTEIADQLKRNEENTKNTNEMDNDILSILETKNLIPEITTIESWEKFLVGVGAVENSQSRIHLIARQAVPIVQGDELKIVVGNDVDIDWLESRFINHQAESGARAAFQNYDLKLSAVLVSAL